LKKLVNNSTSSESKHDVLFHKQRYSMLDRAIRSFSSNIL